MVSNSTQRVFSTLVRQGAVSTLAKGLLSGPPVRVFITLTKSLLPLCGWVLISSIRGVVRNDYTNNSDMKTLW